MPRVPIYDSPQQELRPLGAPKADSVASPELFGEPARQQAELAKGLIAAGTGAAAVAYKMQEREDADMVFRAETAVKDEWLKNEQELRKRQGRFAKGITEDTQKWWEERTAHHSGNLGNDNQRRTFQQRATAFRLTTVDSVSKYEAQHLERSHDEAWGADKGVTISTAAANPTPDSIDRARLELERLNRYQAARKGWEGAQLEAANLKDKTTLHQNVIQGLAETNPIAAEVYFKLYKHEIDGTLHAEIGDFSKKTSANALAEITTQGVWDTMGPKNDRTPAELDKMENALRAELKGNEPALDSAIKRLRERVSAFKDARRERDGGLEATVNQAIMGGASRAQVARMPEFNLLSPEAARKIDTFLENRAYTAEVRDAAADARREREFHRRSLDTTLALQNPDELMRLTRNQVANLLPVLGESNTTNLLARWDAFSENPEKLTEARMDKEDFTTVALELGLRPNEPKKGEEEKDQLVRLQSRVENVIGMEQAVLKRPLKREEKMAIMRKEMDNRVIVDRIWPFSDQSKPLGILKPGELGDAYVMVGEQKVELASIPALERAAIITERRKRGLPITEADIARTWIAGKAAK